MKDIGLFVKKRLKVLKELIRDLEGFSKDELIESFESDGDEIQFTAGVNPKRLLLNNLVKEGVVDEDVFENQARTKVSKTRLIRYLEKASEEDILKTRLGPDKRVTYEMIEEFIKETETDEPVIYVIVPEKEAYLIVYLNDETMIKPVSEACFNNFLRLTFTQLTKEPIIMDSLSNVNELFRSLHSSIRVDELFGKTENKEQEPFSIKRVDESGFYGLIIEFNNDLKSKINLLSKRGEEVDLPMIPNSHRDTLKNVWSLYKGVEDEFVKENFLLLISVWYFYNKVFT